MKEGLQIRRETGAYIRLDIISLRTVKGRCESCRSQEILSGCPRNMPCATYRGEQKLGYLLYSFSAYTIG